MSRLWLLSQRPPMGYILKQKLAKILHRHLTTNFDMKTNIRWFRSDCKVSYNFIQLHLNNVKRFFIEVSIPEPILKYNRTEELTFTSQTTTALMVKYRSIKNKTTKSWWSCVFASLPRTDIILPKVYL